MERIPMTQEAYNRRKAEIDELENVVMPQIAIELAAARDEGDLKENAEYHAQREKQGLTQAKINQLKGTLVNAQIVRPEDIPHDRVAFGATVKVLDMQYDDEETITLVGEGDEDYANGKYKITSPYGQGLVGKQVGDIAEIPVPKGTLKLKVLAITYENE